MKKLFSFFQPKVLQRAVAIFLVSGLLVFSTACTSPSATVEGTNSALSQKEGTPTTQYGGKPKAEHKGGMNQYSDIDPRRDTAAIEAKTKYMVDKAQQQVSRNANPIDTVKSELDKVDLPETIDKISGHVSHSVQKQADEVVEKAKEGLQNLS